MRANRPTKKMTTILPCSTESIQMARDYLASRNVADAYTMGAYDVIATLIEAKESEEQWTA